MTNCVLSIVDLFLSKKITLTLTLTQASSTSDDSNSSKDDDTDGDDNTDFEITYTDKELQKTRDVFVGAIEGTEIEDTAQTDGPAKKVSATVAVPGYGQQYKSHLVSLLNDNPTLSHDRLTRVRQVQSSKTSKAKVLIIIRKAATDAEEG